MRKRIVLISCVSQKLPHKAKATNWRAAQAPQGTDYMSKECEAIHVLARSLERHDFPFSESQIPLNGIYILFEKGEDGHGGDRIVRIGTHTGENQLRSRLKQHFLNEKSKRLETESKVISTVSWCKNCRPSNNWLGNSSPKQKIVESGLWLVNELYKTPFDASGLEDLSKLIEDEQNKDSN